MPVVGLDRQAVEMRYAALGAEALLELAQLRGDVGDRRVDLAREEITAAEPLERGAQLAVPRHELAHQEERNRARVRLREVAEVVVRRDLAAEYRVVLAHPLLDER